MQSADLVACAHNSEPVAEVAFGDGFEIALARAGDVVTVPEWVQIFPKGPEIVARDGRRWTLPDPSVLVSAFAANQGDLPADIEHASEKLAPLGHPAPAQAWVKEIQVRADGTSWARLQWTAAGRAAVESGSYRYISPAFLHTADKVITALKSIALVTQPALVMPALAARDQVQPTQQQETPAMTTFLARVRTAMGLSHDATEDQIVEHATSQVSLARDARDPTKLVPAAELAAAQKRASDAETALATRDAADTLAANTAAVDGAIAAGKLTPAARAEWLAMASANREAFDKAIAAMPVITAPTDTAKKPEGGGAGDANGLTADQLAVCSRMGLDPVAYAATLKLGAA